MARNSLLCADVPLRNYSLTHSLLRTIDGFVASVLHSCLDGFVVTAVYFHQVAFPYFIVCNDGLDEENLRRLTCDSRSACVYAGQKWYTVGFTVDSRGCVLALEFTYDTGETRLCLLSFGAGAINTRVLMTKDVVVGV